MQKTTAGGITFRDLGLDYASALHGIQTAVLFEMESEGPEHPKHTRTGLNARAADASGLAALLISKGVFTADEYCEFMRLAMNEELARYQELHLGITFR